MALKEKRSVQNILSIELPFCEYPSSKLQAPEEFKRLKDDLKDSKNECDNRKKCEWRFTGEVEFHQNFQNEWVYQQFKDSIMVSVFDSASQVVIWVMKLIEIRYFFYTKSQTPNLASLAWLQQVYGSHRPICQQVPRYYNVCQRMPCWNVPLLQGLCWQSNMKSGSAEWIPREYQSKLPASSKWLMTPLPLPPSRRALAPHSTSCNFSRFTSKRVAALAPSCAWCNQPQLLVSKQPFAPQKPL